MQTTFTDTVLNNRKYKIQGIVPFVIVVIGALFFSRFTHPQTNLLHKLVYLMGLWLFWIIIKETELLQKIKDLDGKILNELTNNDKVRLSNYVQWNCFKKRLPKWYRALIIVNGMLMYLSLPYYQMRKEIHIIIFNFVLIHFIVRIKRIAYYTGSLSNLYLGENTSQTIPAIDFKRLIGIGLAIGLPFTLILLFAFNLSFIESLLAYFAFSYLSGLGLILHETFKLVENVVREIDEVRLGKVE